jgi:diguanylate cyclase (GGDEF)-like protein
MDVLKELLKNDIKLPSPPNIALRLLEALKAEAFSLNELTRIIHSDPALTAKVLKAVNSTFYISPDKISNIEQALSILGVHVVKNIALSFTLVEDLKMHSAGVFDIDYFWKRSIIAAIGAEIFTGYLQRCDDDIFVSALLQDLGVLILNCYYPDRYSKLIEEKNITRVPLEILEEKAFGFNHQELCSEILNQWGLPENIYLPIRYHHGYGDAPEQYRYQARILYLSNALSSIFSDTDCYEKIRHFAGIIKDDLAVSDSLLESLVDRCGKRIIEICTSFEIPSGNIKPMAHLLQEANEGLSELNLSYEKLLAEYMKERKQTEKMVQVLKETNDKLSKANQQLQEISIHDYLTGLYNRRYLFDFLDKELNRAQRYKVCFSVMIFDIDFFKKINDTYGHQSGDLVLKAISDKATEMTRRTDLVARFGGEEFVMVMPHTGAKGAMTIAERLREAIEGMDIAVDGQTVKITISAGVATYQPHPEKMTIDEFIEKADKALYDAKSSGRNRVLNAAAVEEADARA